MQHVINVDLPNGTSVIGYLKSVEREDGSGDRFNLRIRPIGKNGVVEQHDVTVFVHLNNG